MKSGPSCSCSWAPLPGSYVPYMTRRDPLCFAHGDETAWWAARVAYAERLAQEFLS